MKIRSRVLALALAGVMSLSLAACGTTKKPEDGALDDVKFLPANETDTAQKLLGIPGDTALITVNGTPITAETYLYFLITNISSYQQYISQYGVSELDWTQESEGKTLGDYMKDQSKQAAISYLLYSEKAKEKNLTLPQESLQDMIDTRSGVIDQIGGETAYGDALQRLGISDSALWSINTAGSLYNVILESELGAAPAEKEPTDEELATYIKDQDLLRCKHILYLTQDATTGKKLPDAALAEKKAKAEDAVKRLGEAADPIALFDTIMKAESEDTGLAGNPDGYVFTKGQMVAPFEEGTRALEFDKISGIVESDFGYHIILRLDPATDEVRTQMKEATAKEAVNARNTEFNTLVTGWMDAAKITLDPAYDTLDPQKYYEGMLAYRDELDAAAAAASPSPEASPDASPAVSPEASPEASPKA